jgi:hypothetical protein
VKNLGLLLDGGAPIDAVTDRTPFLASWCWRKFDVDDKAGVSARLKASRKRDKRFLAVLG